MTDVLHPETPHAATLPDFDDVAAVLQEADIALSAAEVHGAICGVLCKKTAETQALQLILQKEAGAANPFLHAMYENSRQQFHDFTFEFTLLLPDDEAPLKDRAEALTAWCQGFLTGLTLIKVPVQGRQPGEVTEAIDDLLEIAKMKYEAVVASEEDETAYVELVEYTRMAALLIYQALQEEK